MDKKLPDLKNESKKATTPKRDSFFGFLTGHALSLRKGRLEFMYESFLNHGDFLIMFIGKKRTLLVNDPAGLKHVFFDNAKNYPKNTPGYQKVAEVLGQGVFTDVGEEWRRGRKIVQPIFNPSKFDHYFDLINDESNQLIKNLEKASGDSEKEVDLSYWTTRYALHVIGRSLLNETLEESFNIISQKLVELIDLTEKKMTRIFPFKTPRVKEEDAQFAEALKDLDGEIAKIIAHEKEKPRKEGKENFIHAFLDSTEKFSDKKILSQVKTMVFAGHETSANVMMWGFYFLMKHPEWQDKIYQEMKEHDFKIESEEEVKDFKNVNLFIKEVLRVRPPAWSFGRVAVSADQIHGEKVLPGDLISISPYLIHHHPDYWERPEEFNPYRFLQEPKYLTFIPYGAGQRVCMGERLANLEMAMMFLKVLAKFRVEPMVPDLHIPMNAQVSLRPHGAVKGKLIKR